MTYATTKKINALFFRTECIKINKIDKIILWTLLTILLLVSISYAYFVNETIMNIVERKEVENSIGELNSEISGLEMEYMSDDIDITQEYAESLGYKMVTNIKYVSLGEKPANLTIYVAEE